MNDQKEQQSIQINLPDLVNYKCAFEIVVQGVKNGTWQGHIYWIDQNRKQHFRSVLEMLNLMDEALAETDQVTHRVSWAV